MSLAALFAFFVLSRSEPIAVPYFSPVQIMRPSADHHGLVATEDLARILGAREQMAVIAVVGPYHSGKSFLLNALAGRTDVFKVGPSTDPETKGLYIARTDRRTEDGKEIWLLDSEGFFGPQVPEEYDAKVFTVAALLSDKLVYNTVKVIDQNAVDRLELLLRRAALFNTKAQQAEGLPPATHPTSHQQLSLPDLCWVVEDFVQTTTSSAASGHQSATESLATDWLSLYLSEESYIRRHFPSVSVHTLFLPATLKPQLQDLSALVWDQLTPEFRMEVARLRLALFGSVKKVYSADMFVKTTHFLASALNKGLFPELPSLWSHWQSQVYEASVRDAGKLFDQLVTRTLDEKLPPLGKPDFAAELRNAEERAVSFFLALVGNDAKIPSALTDQIQTRAVASSRIHAEKVDKYLSARVRAAVSDFKVAAGKVTLPTESEGLSIALSRAKDEVAGELEKTANSLGMGLGAVGELSSALAGIVSGVIEDNHRRIASILQSATVSAGATVEDALNSLGDRLFGAQEMRAFELELKEKTMKKFETELEHLKPWIKTMPLFHTTAQTVKSETQAKLTRFEAQHAVKIADLFRKLADRVLAEYRESRKDLELRSLPAEESSLRERHQAIEAAIVERFTELAGNLADSENFKTTKSRLLDSVRVEMQKLLRKNVELWKVHSDEATQCAVAMNVDYRKNNCWNGWMCLFALWPPTHRVATKSHLNSCFDKLQGSIPKSMRDSVFDSFYEKEMGREVNDVQRNLWITLVAVLAPLVWWTLLKINRN